MSRPCYLLAVTLEKLLFSFVFFTYKMEAIIPTQDRLRIKEDSVVNLTTQCLLHSIGPRTSDAYIIIHSQGAHRQVQETDNNSLLSTTFYSKDLCIIFNHHNKPLFNLHNKPVKLLSPLYGGGKCRHREIDFPEVKKW